jgi:type I restriction enzyme S subunit
VSEFVEHKLGDVARVTWGDTNTTKASYKERGFLAFSAAGPDGFLDHYDYECDGIVLSAIGAKCGGTWFASGRWSCIKNTIVITKPAATVDIRYLYYVISDPAIWPKRGAAQPFISQTDARAVSVMLPPLPTQQRIAAILSAYDDLIETNTRRIAILEDMARRLYEEWLLPQASDESWTAAHFSKTLDGHIGGGWGKEEADGKHIDLAFVIRGTDIPGARVLETAKCPLRYHASSNLRSRSLADGDLILEVSGGSKDQLVGRPILVSQRLLNSFAAPVICASFCKRLQVNRQVISPLLLYHYLCRAYADGTMAQFQVQSTGITNFQFKPFLEKAEVPIPPKDIQKHFDALAGPMRRQIELLGANSVNLRAQRDLLLPKLVSGEIDVSAAEAALEAAG